MFKIEGYRFTDKVYEGTHIAIWRGTRNLDNLPVTAKLLKARYPMPQELNRLEHEYTIGKILDIPGVIKYYSIKNVWYVKPSSWKILVQFPWLDISVPWQRTSLIMNDEGNFHERFSNVARFFLYSFGFFS